MSRGTSAALSLLLLLLVTFSTRTTSARHHDPNVADAENHRHSSFSSSSSSNANTPPSTGEAWVTLARGLEFQPSGDQDWSNPKLQAARDEAQSRLLTKNADGSTASTATLFVDSQYKEYDGYQQAWRYMGFYIDCSTANNQNDNKDDHHRHLPGEDDRNGGGSMGCTRYLLWAAYVDLDYEGGGIGEYEYYDLDTKTWNANACAYGVGRCVKMDCHLSDTHFSLLGFFKHDSQAYGEWFGQVFKHEGYCIWDSDEYSFMQSTREKIPQRCKDTGLTSSNGTTLYYHLKPLSDGDITIGIYTDSACSKDYSGSDVTMASLGWDQDTIDEWNEGFGIYKVCQPCTAHSLQYVSSGRRERRERELGQNGIFDCYDAAEYTNVNQCMKFYTKTTMYPASLSDVGMAVSQGTTTYSPISSRSSYEIDQRNAVRYAAYVPKKQPVASKWFLGFSIFTLVAGMATLYRVSAGQRFSFKFGPGCHARFGDPFSFMRSSKEPLMVPSPNMVAA